jgi:hypothetical protein
LSPSRTRYPIASTSWRASHSRRLIRPADRPGVVAVEVSQLGGDVLPYPFGRQFQGLLFVEVLPLDVHEDAFVGGCKDLVA